MFYAKTFISAALVAAAVSPAVDAHGFIKEWGVKGNQLVKAQKTDLKSSSFRAVPSNTGWIGSKCTSLLHRPFSEAKN